MGEGGGGESGSEAWCKGERLKRLTFLSSLMILEVKGLVSFFRISGGFSPEERPGVALIRACG